MAHLSIDVNECTTTFLTFYDAAIPQSLDTYDANRHLRRYFWITCSSRVTPGTAPL